MEDMNYKKEDFPSDSRARKVLRIIGMVFMGVIFALLFALVFGFIVKWLWNFLMPDLFGLSQISYLQAFAMVILAKLLFGAFGPHHPRRPPPRRPPFGRRHEGLGCHGSVPWDKRNILWEDFSRYWQSEGKEAFDSYIKKTRAENE